jgi:hypothetical protein
MLEGLRRESPRVVALARRVPNPRFARSSPLWAVLAAAGAGFFVSSTILVLFTLVARLLGLPTEWIGGVATVGALATALSVAYTIGGIGAAVVYAGIVVVERLLELPGLMRFCAAVLESSVCSPLSYVLGLWPEALGIAVATRLALWMRTTDGDGNPLLEAAGALAFTQGIVISILGAVLLSTSGFASGVLLLLSAVAGGVACGLVLLRRVTEPRQWRALGIIASFVIGVWLLVSVPTFAGQAGIGGTIAIGGLSLLGFAAPILEVGSAAIVLYMAAARRVTATVS